MVVSLLNIIVGVGIPRPTHIGDNTTSGDCSDWEELKINLEVSRYLPSALILEQNKIRERYAIIVDKT